MSITDKQLDECRAHYLETLNAIRGDDRAHDHFSRVIDIIDDLRAERKARERLQERLESIGGSLRWNDSEASEIVFRFQREAHEALTEAEEILKGGGHD